MGVLKHWLAGPHPQIDSITTAELSEAQGTVAPSQFHMELGQGLGENVPQLHYLQLLDGTNLCFSSVGHQVAALANPQLCIHRVLSKEPGKQF